MKKFFSLMVIAALSITMVGCNKEPAKPAAPAPTDKPADPAKPVEPAK